jgi:hypothetical protein
MGNPRKPGLTNCGIWHLDKQFRGVRIRESARTGSVTEAIALLANRIDGVRQSQLYGVLTNRTFREAARKYLEMNKQKKCIRDDENYFTKLDPFIGDVSLSSVMSHPWEARRFVTVRSPAGTSSATDVSEDERRNEAI